MVATVTQPLPEVSGSEFLAQFDPAVRPALGRLLDRDGVDGLFLAECHDLSSSYLGSRAAVVFGPGCTFTAADLVAGRVTGGLSHQRKTLVNWASKAAVRAALAAAGPPDLDAQEGE